MSKCAIFQCTVGACLGNWGVRCVAWLALLKTIVSKVSDFDFHFEINSPLVTKRHSLMVYLVHCGSLYLKTQCCVYYHTNSYRGNVF